MPGIATDPKCQNDEKEMDKHEIGTRERSKEPSE
jgi:hypothetical protein